MYILYLTEPIKPLVNAQTDWTFKKSCCTKDVRATARYSFLCRRIGINAVYYFLNTNPYGHIRKYLRNTSSVCKWGFL